MPAISPPLSPPRPVLWPQVWALAIAQGAITLSWVIYNLYLVQLLTRYGFSEGFATALLVLEAGAAVVLEPLMGNLSDQTQRWIGSRFPFVAGGGILASLCFIAIPLGLVLGNPLGPTRWLLPFVMVVWALSMTVFRSPVLSLLGRYAISTRQPQAASILTLVGSVAGALAPLAGNAILSVGPLLAFTVGSVVLLGSATVLRLTRPNQAAQSARPPEPAPPRSRWPLAAIFGTGLSITLGLQILLRSFPVILGSLMASPQWVMGLVFLTIAALAIPMGNLARQMGLFKAMAIGLGLIAPISVSLAFVGTPGIAILVAIAIGGSMSLISNCTIPIALAAAPADRAGLGTGLYFGGAALATSLFSTVSRIASPGDGVLLLLGAIAFAGAIALIQPIRLAQSAR